MLCCVGTKDTVVQLETGYTKVHYIKAISLDAEVYTAFGKAIGKNTRAV